MARRTSNPLPTYASGTTEELIRGLHPVDLALFRQLTEPERRNLLSVLASARAFNERRWAESVATYAEDVLSITANAQEPGAATTVRGVREVEQSFRMLATEFPGAVYDIERIFAAGAFVWVLYRARLPLRDGRGSTFWVSVTNEFDAHGRRSRIHTVISGQLAVPLGLYRAAPIPRADQGEG